MTDKDESEITAKDIEAVAKALDKVEPKCWCGEKWEYVIVVENYTWFLCEKHRKT